jgi:hypothetical protein
MVGIAGLMFLNQRFTMLMEVVTKQHLMWITLRTLQAKTHY